MINPSKIINRGLPKRMFRKNDRDGDGKKNKRDCQPGNVMRQDGIKKIFVKGNTTSWDYGDGTAKILAVDNNGVKFKVSGFARLRSDIASYVTRKTWPWIKNNLSFFEL